MSHVTRLLIFAMVATIGFVAGAAFGVTAAESAPQGVLHLRVEIRGTADVPPRTVEYWLDEQRGLARSSEASAEGSVIQATGPGWFMHVPARGDIIRYEAPFGAGVTKSITSQLFFMRDAMKARVARVYAQDANTLIVEIDQRRAAIERGSGLPIWQTVGSSRVEFMYVLREVLPSAQFPETFFTAAPPRVVRLTE